MLSLKCSSNPILDFDNKLMKGTNYFCKLVEDISKGVRLFRLFRLCCSSAYMFTIKCTPSKENFNDYAKIPVAPILYRKTTPGTYLEPSHTSTMELFCKKKPSAIFSKALYPRLLTGF